MSSMYHQYAKINIMGRANRAFSGIKWSIITNIVNAVYGFIMIPILINYFGKAEYGLIGLAQSVNAYMRLMDMGLTSTNVRFFSNWLEKHEFDRVKKLFSTCTAFYGVVGLVNAMILMVICLFSSSVFHVTPDQDVILKKLLLILALAAFINWFTSCYNQIIQATENVAWTQKRLLVTKLLMVLVLGITVWLKLDIITYFFLTILCNWMILPWVIKKVKKETPFVSFLPKFDKSVFKEILPYTLNIFSFTIFSFSYNNLLPVFLGIRSVPESVADYKVIMGISGIITAITGVFLSALLPSSSRIIASNDRVAYEKIAYTGTKYLMAFTGFCVFGLMTVAKDILILYVGESFLNLLPWLYVMLFLMITNHILCLSSLILGGSDIRPLSRMTAVSSILALASAWIFIPKYDVGGVVIANIVYNMGQTVFYYCYYWPKILLVDSRLIFVKYFVPVTAFGLALWFALINIPHLSNHWWNTLLLGVVFAIVYGLFTLLFLNREEKKYIFKLLNIRNNG